MRLNGNQLIQAFFFVSFFFLLSQARSFGLAVSIIALNGFASLSANLFPILSETIHLYGCMTMYAVCSAFGIIFVAIVIKETKGKSLHTIDKESDEPRDWYIVHKWLW